MREREAHGNVTPYKRQEEEIAQVSATGAAQMGMGESEDRGVAVVISGTAVPGPVPCVRAQLHHSERSGSPRVSMTMKAGSDKRIRKRDRFCPGSPGTSRYCR